MIFHRELAMVAVCAALAGCGAKADGDSAAPVSTAAATASGQAGDDALPAEKSGGVGGGRAVVPGGKKGGVGGGASGLGALGGMQGGSYSECVRAGWEWGT